MINNYAQLRAEEERKRRQQEYLMIDKAAEDMKQRNERNYQERLRRQKEV